MKWLNFYVERSNIFNKRLIDGGSAGGGSSMEHPLGHRGTKFIPKRV